VLWRRKAEAKKKSVAKEKLRRKQGPVAKNGRGGEGNNYASKKVVGRRWCRLWEEGCEQEGGYRRGGWWVAGSRAWESPEATNHATEKPVPPCR